MDPQKHTESQKQAEADYEAVVTFGLPMYIAGRCMGCFDKANLILQVIMRDDPEDANVITKEMKECWCTRCFAWYAKCYEQFGLAVEKRALAQADKKEILH